MEELRGKLAVVTGAADGIGRAVASRAAQAGMRVVLADVDAVALERTVAELVARGAEAMGVLVDVSDVESVKTLAHRAVARFGPVSLLVNNAGVASAHAAWDAPLGEWTRVIGVNLLGVVHGLAAFLPGMIASGQQGHVVNVASAAGLVSAPGLGAYCASKSAVVSLSECLHHDLRARNTLIGVSVVCPSWVKTQIASRPIPAEMGTAGTNGVDDVTQGVRAAISGAVRGGVPVDEVAEIILEAVRVNRFYVVTHEATKTGVSIRARDIVEGRPPTLFPWDPKRP